MIDRAKSYLVYNSGILMEVTHDPSMYERTQADTMVEGLRKDKFLILDCDDILKALKNHARLISRCKQTDPFVQECKQHMFGMKINVENRNR